MALIHVVLELSARVAPADEVEGSPLEGAGRDAPGDLLEDVAILGEEVGVVEVELGRALHVRELDLARLHDVVGHGDVRLAGARGREVGLVLRGRLLRAADGRCGDGDEGEGEEGAHPPRVFTSRASGQLRGHFAAAHSMPRRRPDRDST